jgi:hypothetical protein
MEEAGGDTVQQITDRFDAWEEGQAMRWQDAAEYALEPTLGA